MSPRHRFGGGIPAPVLPAGSFADRFLAEHTAEPWRTPQAVYAMMPEADAERRRTDEERSKFGAMLLGVPSLHSARAGELYDRYVDEAEAHEEAGTLAPDETVLSHRDFGLLLAERGYKGVRDQHGMSYYGLTTDTRAERADKAARRIVRGRLNDRFEAEAKARHMAEVSHTETRQRIVGNPKYDTSTVTDEVEVPCDHRERVDLTSVGLWNVSVWVAEGDRMTEDAIEADPTMYESEVARVRAMYEV